MTNQDSITSWYTQLSETYTTEQRKSWYSATAAAYNRVRPRYPARIIDQVLGLVQLPPKANIIELGCGPGIATTEFAKRGFSLVYQQCICHVTYNIDDYLALLSTLSPYIKLEAQQRATLLMNLKNTLENMGNHQISLSYLSAFHLAQKV